MPEGVKELIVVPLMKAYARLVKNIYTTHKGRTYLSCKPYTLRLTARKCACGTGKSQVVKSDAFKESESVLDLFKDKSGYIHVTR